MAKITYPPKPWVDGQYANLQAGMRFIYSASLRKWVPITHGLSKEEDLQQGFGVSTVEEVEALFVDVSQLKDDMITFGRIWNTLTRPNDDQVHHNDVWIDPANTILFYWNQDNRTWIQLTASPNRNSNIFN